MKIIRPYMKYLIPVLVLMAILLAALPGRSPFGRKNSSFAVSCGNEITRIELSEGGKKLALEKKEDEWLVNGKEETRKNRMNFLLDVLNEMKIKSPVSDDLFDREIRDKGIEPVRVRVFQGRRLLKSFLVYRTSSNPYGNIMKIRERSKPFILNVPGVTREIGSLFTSNELMWKPFYLFSFPMNEIEEVYFRDMNDPGSSFIIRRNNNRFTLSDITGDLTGWDSLRVTRYVSYFFNIPFEDWALDMTKAEKDSVRSIKPLYVIGVVTAGGVKNEVTMWARTITESGLRKTDSDRLWAGNNDSEELMIVKYFDVDPLLKKKTYFFPD